jgi:hypothetical protein
MCMIQICDLIIILINFVIVQTPNKQLLTTDEERLNKRLATTPTERFRLLINLFKLNQKLKRANQPK